VKFETDLWGKAPAGIKVEALPEGYGLPHRYQIIGTPAVIESTTHLPGDPREVLKG